MLELPTMYPPLRLMRQCTDERCSEPLLCTPDSGWRSGKRVFEAEPEETAPIVPPRRHQTALLPQRIALEAMRLWSTSICRTISWATQSKKSRHA